MSRGVERRQVRASHASLWSAAASWYCGGLFEGLEGPLRPAGLGTRAGVAAHQSAAASADCSESLSLTQVLQQQGSELPASLKRQCYGPDAAIGSGGDTAAGEQLDEPTGAANRQHQQHSEQQGHGMQQQQQQQLDIPAELLPHLQPEDIEYNLRQLQSYQQQQQSSPAAAPAAPSSPAADPAFSIPPELRPFLSPETLAYCQRRQQTAQVVVGSEAQPPPLQLQQWAAAEVPQQQQQQQQQWAVGEVQQQQQQQQRWPDVGLLSQQPPQAAGLAPLSAADTRAVVQGRVAALRAEIASGESVLRTLRAMLHDAEQELQQLR